MIEDDILKEIRAVRDAFACSHGYNVRSMVEYLRKLDERGDRRVVRLEPRRLTPTDIAAPVEPQHQD